ncbi:MAG: hypothetical protein Q8R58_10015 [Sulfuricurvum sp.]|nr:hypothetical protein [Sulfuricurvum sp.]
MLAGLFQKIFVAIISDKDGYDIQTIVVKKKKILHKESRHFEGDVPSPVMIRYINDVIDPSPFFYISTLNLHANQGAYDGCSKPPESLQSQDAVGIQTLCRDEKWTQYASQDALYQLRSQYNTIGLDFIFSPFSMIEFYFADKIKNSFALYAFGMPELFSVAIFDGGKLEYAHHYARGSSKSASIDEEVSEMEFTSSSLGHEVPEGSILLDDIEDLEDLDLLDDLDSFGDIADLDDLDEVSEFSEDTLTPEEIRQERDHNTNAVKNEIDDSSEEYARFEFIQKTLQRFYASSHCHNRFIETVCIADSSSGGDELKRYLEEELFLNVLIRKVDVCEGINALAQVEVEGL